MNTAARMLGALILALAAMPLMAQEVRNATLNGNLKTTEDGDWVIE